MYIYIHGFASCIKISTLENLSIALNEEPVYGIDYDSSMPFDTNITSLLGQINEITNGELDELVLIGSSLGAYYAMQLANRLDFAKVVCINPVVEPEQLKKFLNNEYYNLYSGKKFVFTQEILDSYPEIGDKRFPMVIFVSDSDEVLEDNYKRVIDKYNNKAYIIQTHTLHRISDFKPYAKKIISMKYHISG